MSNGDRSKMPTGMPMVDVTCDPERISTIKAYSWLDPSNVHKGRVLVGFEFFDMNNNILLTAGDCSRIRWPPNEIKLAKNERLIGLQSWTNPESPAVHVDVSFKLISI